ncbi:hypothetical protein DPEC_G00332860, partial [Dallia pectoralis]
DSQKVSGDRLSLKKKLLDLSPIYIDGCHEALREAAHRRTTTPGKAEHPCSRYSPGPLSPQSPPVSLFGPQKDSGTIISRVFVTQEDGHSRGGLLSPHALKGNANSDSSHRQPIAKTTKITKCTYTENGVGPARTPKGPSVSSPAVHSISIDVITVATTTSGGVVGSGVSTSVTAPSNGVTNGATESSNASPIPALAPVNSGPSLGPNIQPSGGGRTNSFFSEPVSCLSLSDSCSNRSSTDSLTGPDRFGPLLPDGPTPLSASSTSPNSPSDGRATSEPIYAESTKRKRGLHSAGSNGTPLAQKQRSEADAEHTGDGQNQRAKITVMAAHTEENNRTFFLSSPDSAVSTQWPHFSPTTLSNPGSPAFRWPSSPSVTEAVSSSTLTSPAYLQPKPQNSPPIPPKRNNRSPKTFLGTSSLSPVPLPELSIQGIQTLSLSPREKDMQTRPPVEPHSSASSDARRHKFHASSRNWEVRIVEEEEGDAEEGHSREETATQGRVTELVNGTAVWTESRERTPTGGTQGSTQTLPGTADNNGASQKPQQADGGAEEGKHSRSMPAKTPPSPLSSTEPTALSGVGKSSSHDPSPPPPPPKKHHRASGRSSHSSMELDQRSQPGSVESLTSSIRGLGSSSLLTASTDSLPGFSARTLSDSGSHDAMRLSPYPRSPMTSSPGSPHPDTFPSDNLSNRLQPPPLPEKKIVNRTLSAPDSMSGKPLVRAYPRLPFAGGSESNVSHPDVLSQSSLLLSTVDPCYSSSESLEHCQGPLGRGLRSQTMDEPLKVCGRLGGHSRGSITSSSSPQLSGAHHLASGSSHGSSLQLQTLLSNIESREGIYSKLGGLYAESLRRLALKCEEHFTRSQKNPLRFDESNWSLFKLTCNKASCNGGDAVYYSAACASDPSNSYAVK